VKKFIIIFLCAIFQIAVSSPPKISTEATVKLKVAISAMVARDQAIRAEILDLQKNYGASFLNKHPRLLKFWQEVDMQNSKKMAAILSQWGWLEAKVVGSKCSEAMWLLIQHSDKNILLQEQALQELKKVARSDKNALKYYAYLFDRVHANKHLPQRYGTQGFCKGPHDWQPFAIEDIKQLNLLRKNVGLESFEKYQQLIQKMCY
jgi:hypothetical protein